MSNDIVTLSCVIPTLFTSRILHSNWKKKQKVCFFLQVLQAVISFTGHVISLHHLCVCFWSISPQWARTFPFTRFLDHTQRRITAGRTPLDKGSARRRDLYLTTHNTHRHPYSRRDANPQSQQESGRRSYALDREAAGTGTSAVTLLQTSKYFVCIATFMRRSRQSWRMLWAGGSCIPSDNVVILTL